MKMLTKGEKVYCPFMDRKVHEVQIVDESGYVYVDGHWLNASSSNGDVVVFRANRPMQVALEETFECEFEVSSLCTLHCR